MNTYSELPYDEDVFHVHEPAAWELALCHGRAALMLMGWASGEATKSALRKFHRWLQTSNSTVSLENALQGLATFLTLGEVPIYLWGLYKNRYTMFFEREMRIPLLMRGLND